MLRRVDSFKQRYDRLLTELKEEIYSGEIKHHEYILSEHQLCSKYELSRPSVRKALDELVQMDLIEKIPGVGNRVIFASPTNTVKLTFIIYADSYEIPILRKLIQQFEELHPGVEIKLQLLSGDYIQGLFHRLDDKDAPDLMMLSERHIRQFQQFDRLPMLSPFSLESFKQEKSMHTELLNMFTYESSLMAVPFVFSPVVICYNRSIFESTKLVDELPLKDWDHLLRTSKSLTWDSDEDGYIDMYGFCFSASPNRWPIFLVQNQGDLAPLPKNDKTFMSYNNIGALQFCIDLMYKHKVSPIYSHGANHLAEKLFKEERSAMILTTYYFMNKFRDHNIQWDVLPLPKGKQQATLLIGSAIALNKQSSSPEIAKAFIDFLTSPASQTLVKTEGCTLPALSQIAEDESITNPSIHPPHFHAFKQVMPYAVSLKGLGLNQDYIELLEEELHLLWTHIENPQETCRRIHDKWTQQLAGIDR